MSRQLLCVFLLLQFHACFASRPLRFFHENRLYLHNHKDGLLRSKEEETNTLHAKGLATNCLLKAELCMGSIKSDSEDDVESDNRTTLLGIDSKLENQNRKRMMEQPMVEARTALETSNPNAYEEGNEADSGRDQEPGEDIEVKDYATPRRKTPIHNDRP